MKVWKTKSGARVIRVLAGRSNAFLLLEGGKRLLVDTGPACLWRILDARLRRLNIGRIDFLVMTHAHSDHAGNARRVQETYGARVIVHGSEAPYLSAGRNIAVKGTGPVSRAIMRTFGGIFAGRFGYRPCRPDVLVDDGLDLHPFGFNARIVHTPGHTPGSLSVIVGDEIALVGDTMFGVFRRSVFPPYACDVPRMMRSWGRLLATGCPVFMPSHGSANSRALVERDYTRRKQQL